MRVISIDWDYFFEQHPALDYAHDENTALLDTVWRVRRQYGDLKKKVPRRVNPFMVLGMAFNTKPRTVAVAESHAAIVKLLKGARKIELINIDAHHDLHYGIPGRLPLAFDCGSWGSALIEAGKITRWTQVYPTWRLNYPEDDNGAFSWARVRLGEKNFNVSHADALTYPPRRADLLFLCRSGCWVPPEYDSAFTSVCNILGVEPLAERSLEVINAGA